MTVHALVVEDDPRVVEIIDDALVSLGHEYLRADNLHDARQLLTDEEFAYVLLDLEFPAKPRRGLASKENGGLLLEEIQLLKGSGRLPVIVMSGHIAFCLDHSNELREKGASDFIAKPFATEGRTLVSVIRHVLRTPKAVEKRFTGGELVFFPDRAELCGTRIISDRGTGQCLMILEALRRQATPRSAEELAQAIGALGGAETAINCISRIRKNIVERLAKQGIVCGRDDVIQSDERGYSLRDWIETRDGEEEALTRVRHRLSSTVSAVDR